MNDLTTLQTGRKKMLTDTDGLRQDIQARPCGSRDKRWYCVQVHYKAESIAAYELDRQNYSIFFPRFVDYQSKGHPIRALFPGYGFVSFALQDRWRPICHTKGVKRLFGASPERPTPARVGEIERLMKRCRSGDSVIDDRQTAPDLTDSSLRILDGAFALQEGICDQSEEDRVRIMLSIFGRPQPVWVARKDVEVA